MTRSLLLLAILFGLNAGEVGLLTPGILDGSGKVTQIRAFDAIGQVFQPDAGRLNFTGWKWLTVAIELHTPHWGGANDGVVKPPRKLDTLLLLDQADQSKPSQSVVRIAGALAVE